MPASEHGLAVRRLVVAGIGVLLAAAVAVLAYRQFVVLGLKRDTASAAADGETVAPSLPPLESPYQNVTAAATYVGSESCQECHADQHASYLETTHSRSLSLADPTREPPDARFEHALSGLTYDVHRDGEQLWHRESLTLDGGQSLTTADRPLKYRVGSGRFARTYLAEIDSFLVESPVTWYASAQAWRMSPGYDGAEHHSFRRNVTDDCLFCHSGRAFTLGGSPSRIKVHEFSIGCERCHGPGSLHVALQRGDGEIAIAPNSNAARDRESQAAGGSVPGDTTIVNPRDLSRDLSEALCQQCHLESLGRSNVQGRTPSDFRPSLRWSDFCVNYDAQSPSGQMTVTGHVQQMHQSRCYQDSSTLTCITCHDMHGRPAPAERVEHYRTACLKCHADQACKLAPAVRQERNANDCAACHMPQSKTDVPHVAFTHHRIGNHTDKPDEPPDWFTAVPLAPVLDVSHLPEAHRRRNLGLAYWQRYVNSWQDSRLDAYRQQADELLQGAFERGLADEPVCAALSSLAGERGDQVRTELLARAVLASEGARPPERVTALNVLAQSRFGQQQYRQAEEALNELVKLRREPRDWVLLARCRERQNNLVSAIAALEKVREIDARMPETYEVLSELYGAIGDRQAQQENAVRGRQMRGRLAK